MGGGKKQQAGGGGGGEAALPCLTLETNPSGLQFGPSEERLWFDHRLTRAPRGVHPFPTKRPELYLSPGPPGGGEREARPLVLQQGVIAPSPRAAGAGRNSALVCWSRSSPEVQDVRTAPREKPHPYQSHHHHPASLCQESFHPNSLPTRASFPHQHPSFSLPGHFSLEGEEVTGTRPAPPPNPEVPSLH